MRIPTPSGSAGAAATYRSMGYTDKQQGVIRNVIPAVIATLVGLCGVAPPLPRSILPSDEPGARLAWALTWALLPALTLMVAIMRVANHRFSTPADIDGSGLTTGTPEVNVLRAVVQNTLEQAVLAIAAYAIWAAVMPHSWLRVIPIAALLFVAGRVFFATGYTRGAPGRAMGFALTAYPTFGMLAAAAVTLILRLLGR